jgi:serine/threonine protein phosphatase PrpC
MPSVRPPYPLSPSACPSPIPIPHSIFQSGPIHHELTFALVCRHERGALGMPLLLLNARRVLFSQRASTARFFGQATSRFRNLNPHLIASGVATTLPEDVPNPNLKPKSPFYFETGYAVYAKRASRPFPPPFLSRPSGSFSDPLTTHTNVRDRRPSVNGQLIKGRTNGDDAILIGDQNFLAVNDGVGAWAQKDRGHAALWSRLIAHFWAVEVEKALSTSDGPSVDELDPVAYLQTAFEQTQNVTSAPNEIKGTTTACSALLYQRSDIEPIIYATNLGDCAIIVIRPENNEVVYRSEGQWHWFDCPRQLGTNSPDTPKEVAVMDIVDIKEGDVVAVLSDGVIDNLWEHEICEKVLEALRKWQSGAEGSEDGMAFVARQLMEATRIIAEDPTAESPFMEHALDEGIATEGGKLDDISVVLGLCRKRNG